MGGSFVDKHPNTPGEIQFTMQPFPHMQKYPKRPVNWLWCSKLVEFPLELPKLSHLPPLCLCSAILLFSTITPIPPRETVDTEQSFLMLEHAWTFGRRPFLQIMLFQKISTVTAHKFNSRTDRIPKHFKKNYVESWHSRRLCWRHGINVMFLFSLTFEGLLSILVLYYKKYDH